MRRVVEAEHERALVVRQRPERLEAEMAVELELADGARDDGEVVALAGAVVDQLAQQAAEDGAAAVAGLDGQEADLADGRAAFEEFNLEIARAHVRHQGILYLGFDRIGPRIVTRLSFE